MKASRLRLFACLLVVSLAACDGDTGDNSRASGGGGVSSGGSGGIAAGGSSGGAVSGGSGGLSTGGSGGGGGAQAGGAGGSTPVPCPAYVDGATTGNLEFGAITEASGVAASRKTADVLFINNDSGDGPKLYVAKKSGQHLGVLTLAGAVAIDWEDIAIGPGPKSGESYLYAGDIGDNAHARQKVVVYRAVEPKVDVSAAAQDLTLDPVEAFSLTYPDGAHDAETLMVDAKTGDLFIVAKSADGTSPVYRKAAPLGSGELEKISTLQFGSGSLPGAKLTTGGDISASGDAILIRTYGSAFLFRRAPGQSVAAALAGEPCPVPVASEPQGEAIGFAADETGYFTLSEGTKQPLYFFAKN
ncbi:MAG: hypothetical protein U0263_16195 [Polyangiaceae bacterium]